MSEKYQNQLEIEKLNKEIIQNILDTVKPEEFIQFYLYHNQQETLAEFGLRNTKQLTKVLKLFNYDFSKPKPSRFKGKTAARTHESYLLGGKKSSATQKETWQNKTEEEKEAWSIKQSIAHTNPTFAKNKAASNKAYRASLSSEEKQRQDALRSQSMKAWWESLSNETKTEIMSNRFKNGQSYNQKDSQPNLEFKALLEQHNINFEREYCLDKKLFDFKIENTLVEINPTFTHNSTFTPFKYNKPIAKVYHKNKSELAQKYNFKCIHIFDWDDKLKIINLLANKQQVIAGRNCEVKEITKEDSDAFLVANHLQGSAKATFRLGLFYKNDLISVMTFGKPRYNKNYQWELIRYCSKAKVIGGAEKLFKTFINLQDPASVISYCDLSKFTGDTYLKLNFKLLRKSSPSKHWYNVRTKEHYTDALLRKQGFSRLINHCDAKDDSLPTNNNRDLMIGAGFVEVFDCGQATYIWQAEFSNEQAS